MASLILQIRSFWLDFLPPNFDSIVCTPCGYSEVLANVLITLNAQIRVQLDDINLLLSFLFEQK